MNKFMPKIPTRKGTCYMKELNLGIVSNVMEGTR